jgi:hypothetical protein
MKYQEGYILYPTNGCFPDPIRALSSQSFPAFASLVQDGSSFRHGGVRTFAKHSSSVSPRTSGLFRSSGYAFDGSSDGASSGGSICNELAQSQERVGEDEPEGGGGNEEGGKLPKGRRESLSIGQQFLLRGDCRAWSLVSAACERDDRGRTKGSTVFSGDCNVCLDYRALYL